MRIKAGTVLVTTSGEYSDYRYNGPFRVLRDFDQAEVAETFRDEWRSTPRDEWDRPSEHDFVAWACANGFIEDLDNTWEWYLGSYGFEPDIDAEPEATK